MSEGKESNLAPEIDSEVEDNAHYAPQDIADTQDITIQTVGNIQNIGEGVEMEKKSDTTNDEEELEEMEKSIQEGSQSQSQPWDPTTSSEELENSNLIDMEAEFVSIIDRGFKANLTDKINVNLVNLEKGSGQGFRKPWKPSVSPSSSTTSLPVLSSRERYIVRAPRGSPTIDEMMRPNFFKNNRSPEMYQHIPYDSQTEEPRVHQSSTPSQEQSDISSMFTTNIFPAEHSTISHLEISSTMPCLVTKTTLCDESQYIATCREYDPMMTSSILTSSEPIYMRETSDLYEHEPSTSMTSEKDLQYKIKKYGLINYSEAAMKVLTSKQTMQHDIIKEQVTSKELSTATKQVKSKYKTEESASSSGIITIKRPEHAKVYQKQIDKEEKKVLPILPIPDQDRCYMSIHPQITSKSCSIALASDLTSEPSATLSKEQLLAYRTSQPIADMRAATCSASGPKVPIKNPLQYRDDTKFIQNLMI